MRQLGDGDKRLDDEAGLLTGLSLIAEYSGSNTLLRRYVHGPGVDEPLVWYEGTGTSDRRWLHADERGSIVAVSNASGAVTNVNSYDESGIPAATNVGRFQYTGQQWIAELGMYHYRARIYSPTFGRFLQTDPIGYAGGMNLYAYVMNDPVNFTDPTGTCPRGTHLETPTGSHIGRCVPDVTTGGGGGSGLGPGLSGSSTSFGSWVCTNCGEMAGSAPDAAAVVMAPHWVWLSGGSFGPNLRQLTRGTAHALGDSLDYLAENYLQPPDGRQSSESYGQCVDRISGGSEALATVGAFSVGAGGAWLGYSRVGLGGGGAGTSLISSAARGSLGSSPIGMQLFGTGNLGGVVGRGLSRISVVGGAAAVGLAVGRLAGAVQRCQ